jgi:uncharacterized protein (UPF0332 family)
MAPKDDADAEIIASAQRLESFLDDCRAGRWGSATISLYFAFEHTIKALLAAAGMNADSHKGVTTLLSLHFVKPKVIPPLVNRYLSNLEERRSTAEYSPQRAAEFTGEEVSTFFSWYETSCDSVLKLLEEYDVDTKKIGNLLAQYNAHCAAR